MRRLLRFIKNLFLYALGKIKPYKFPYSPDHTALIQKSMTRDARQAAKKEFLDQYTENPVRIRHNQQINLCTDENEYGEEGQARLAKMRAVLEERKKSS